MKNSKQILASVASYFHESPETLTGPSRYTSATIPRYVAMKLIRDNLGYSLPRIGRIFRRTHSTVFSGLHCLENKIQNRPDIACMYNELEHKLFGNTNTEKTA
jgi:chromosomal replication initiator protein